MKTIIPFRAGGTLTNYVVFGPAGANAGTLNFSNYATAFPDFDITRVLAVMDMTLNKVIYATGSSTVGMYAYNSSTKVLTVMTDTSSCASGDALQVIYDDNRAPVTLDAPSATGPAQGWKPYNLLSAATTNATSVKATAGTLGGVSFCSTQQYAAPWFASLKFYDKASVPTVGTDTPVFQINIFEHYGGIFSIPAAGIKFQNGIAFAITVGGSIADTTAVAVNAVSVSLLYS